MMRREWPLLVGLALSAGLVFWSTTIGVAVGEKPKADSRRTADMADVQPAAVPTAAPPSADGAPKTARKRPKPADATKRPSKGGASRGGSSAEGATAVPDEGPAGTGGGSSGSNGGGTREPARELPSGPVVVEVTGNAGEASRGGIAFRFDASGHAPVVGADWTVGVRAAKAGRAVKGEVRVDVVHQGKVVGHIDTGRLRAGRYAHTVQWPAESVGHPLTLKVAITTANGVDQTFLYKLKVRAS